MIGAMHPAVERHVPDVVLVVDDRPDNLALLHDTLEESGYSVLVAPSGEAALQRAAQSRPDIVLLDLLMPEMDGTEVCRRLRADTATERLPILFLTANRTTRR